MAITKKPTGVTIKRDGALRFVVSWKVADENYDIGQQVRFRGVKTNGKAQDWTSYNVASGTTSRSHSLTVADWHPNGSSVLDYIEVEVRGKKSGADWSDWSTKTLSVSAPARPTIETTLDETNQSTFAWNVSISDTDNKPFVRVKYQSILKKACTETDGSKLSWVSSNPGWATGTGSASGSATYEEDTSRLAVDSYTRWIRVMSRGAGGDSAWRYAKHVYATPYKPKIKKVTATDDGTYTTIYVKWTSKTDAAHPIDQTTVEYVIATPTAAGLVYNDSTWTTGKTISDTSGEDAVQFSFTGVVGADQCLYVRVYNQHDSNIAYSDVKLVKKGTLTAPTLGTVTVDSTNHLIDITATNNSSVPDSQLAVIFRMKGANIIIGIIPNGSTSLTALQCPDWGTRSIAIGVKAFQGSYTTITRADGVTVYTLTKNMQSANVWRAGDVPMEAGNVTARASTTAGEVILTWDWDWSEANQAEISWADDPNAWESTEQPETYTLENDYAAQWRVSGLETGKTWYFAVRLMYVTDTSSTYGDWSDVVSVDLSSAPSAPLLALSNQIIGVNGTTTATWSYVSTDGTPQVSAEIYECTVNGSTVTYDSLIATTETAYNAEISGNNWNADSTVYLAVRVTSASGLTSEFSDPVALYIAQELICTISDTSLVSSFPAGMENTMPTLAELPLTATITGAGAGGITTLIIERADEYHMERPDDSMRDGHDGETIVLYRQTGEDQITVTADNLIGTFDDGASYRLIATVEDGYGQSDSAETTFVINWTHQAGIPTATVTAEDGIAVITATAPATYASGDTVDIYRLSADKPQLIVQGGAFGTAYVDPYPALGEHAGYRCVCITADGDYITANNQPAWVDVTDELFDNATGYVHFNGESIPIQYNVKLSGKWAKDFKETKYLGGSVKGDWNPAVSRTSTVNVSVPTSDTDLAQSLRRLSEYNGLCHVRTQDGSCFTADVQVSAAVGYDSAGKNTEYTLTITRVEPEGLDGVAYSEWAVS